MQYLSENGIGFHLLNLVVPIVSGAVIFDLTVGDPSAYPGPAMGREACMNASQEVSMGNVGAGTGALIGWAANLNQRMKGGLGTASASRGNLVVGAIVVVNCMGNVYDPETGELLGGTLDPTGRYILDGYEEMKNKQDALSLQADPEGLTTHTTIGVVATNAILSKPMATRMAMMAHDGYARSINPSHTSGDGDTIFSIATGEVESNIDIVGSMAAEAMARAIAKAIRYADSAYGYKSYSELSKSL
jgi:L-aminopeptidase/D-esterase-like protein